MFRTGGAVAVVARLDRPWVFVGTKTARRPGRELVLWWACSRAIVLAAAAVGQVDRLFRPHWHPSLLSYPFALLGSWDGRWYKTIAEHGYLLIPGRFSDPAFFPLLPFVERVGQVVGLPPVFAGALAANLGFLAGLFAVYALGREFLPEPDARRAARYLAIFPAGFVFSMAYPEGIVLPLAALAGLFAIREQWLASAACTAAATLARPEGILLALPIAAIVVKRWPVLSIAGRAKAAAAVFAGPVGLASFSLYLWSTLGDPLAWSKAESAWGRSFAINGVRRAFAELVTSSSHGKTWLWRDGAFCLIYLALLMVALRAGVPLSWILAGAGMVLLPLASGSFTSDARFGLLAVPCFWGLAVLGRKPWVNRVIIVSSPLLLAAAVLTIPLRFP
jgi:hypothetical protein